MNVLLKVTPVFVVMRQPVAAIVPLPPTQILAGVVEMEIGVCITTTALPSGPQQPAADCALK